MTNQKWALVAGAAVGAGMMYLLDPRGGTRRRALIRDKVVRATRKTGDALDTVAHDMANRARGVAAETAAAILHEPVSGRKLLERVRAELGRVCSHPRAIDVDASDDGHVSVRGPVLAAEADHILNAVAAVRGVLTVEDGLERHETSEGVPSLQGESSRPAGAKRWLLRSWSPTAKALMFGSTAVAVGLGYAAKGHSNGHTTTQA